MTAGWTNSTGQPPPEGSAAATFLERAVVVLRAESQAREGLEHLIAQVCTLGAVAIHLAGEPIEWSAGRVLLPGGSEALRVSALGEPQAVAEAAPVMAIVSALVPLLRDVERKADTRHVLQSAAVEQGGLLGTTPVMRQLQERIARAARKNFIVLIEGESGVGKELVARQVHAMSERRGGPFVPLNCAAIVESLIEAELFGIEERTATGVRGRRGKFEQADGGTLFLDEVSDLSPSAQAKLLRVIQEPTVERVGGYGGRRVDVRIVAATNRPLEMLCRRGEFRWDLFYRLNAVEVSVPPLRARRDDIPALVEAIVQRSADGQPYRVAPDALDALMLYEWPGNVRELERVIERAVTLARTQVLDVDDLPEAVTGRYRDVLAPGGDADDSMRAWGSRYARMVLRRVAGNKREACRVLDISYHTLQAYLSYTGPRRVRAARPAMPLEAGDRERECYTPSPGRAPSVVHERPAPRLDT
ncbi:MAG: sigma 54-interacting transcriptional regulator [Luteitalea sp.]|nr:sigma 54-interacting transcriptional regulator [Acidobacteriota bacterium]